MAKVQCKACGCEHSKKYCPICGYPAKSSVTDDDIKWLAKLFDEKGDIGWTVNERGEVVPYIEITSEDREEAERASRIMNKIVGHPPVFSVTRGRKKHQKRKE